MPEAPHDAHNNSFLLLKLRPILTKTGDYTNYTLVEQLVAAQSDH